jgi:hypothetical protein
MDEIIYTRNGVYTHIYYTPLDTFMGTNPPCKECLIQNMCIDITPNTYHKEELKIRTCDRLTNFVENNYWFDKR